MRPRPISPFPWTSFLVPMLLLSNVTLVRSQDVDPRAIGGIGLTVYTDRNYGAESATFREDVPNLSDYAGLNDAISSLKAGTGEFWEVCEDSRYRGRCVVVSETEANLGSVGWNDRISSLRRVRADGEEPPDVAEIVLYSSRDFSGQSVSFDGAVRNLAQLGFNDRARSARIIGRWQLCRDSNYRDCVIIDRSFPSLQPLGLDRRISSLRPIDEDEGEPGEGWRLTLYDRRNYAGDSQTLDVGTSFLFIFAGRAESARVVGRWQVCTRVGFSGDCKILSEDVSDLETMGLRDRIISVRPVRP